MDIGTALAITSFIAIALYNVVELNFIIFATFKKKRGLYFWSFLVATWSIAPYAVGFLIKGLQLSTVSIFYVTLIVVGWIGMVTGQSVVLYSRLQYATFQFYLPFVFLLLPPLLVLSLESFKDMTRETQRSGSFPSPIPTYLPTYLPTTTA